MQYIAFPKGKGNSSNTTVSELTQLMHEIMLNRRQEVRVLYTSVRGWTYEAVISEKISQLHSLEGM